MYTLWRTQSACNTCKSLGSFLVQISVLEDTLIEQVNLHLQIQHLQKVLSYSDLSLGRYADWAQCICRREQWNLKIQMIIFSFFFLWLKNLSWKFFRLQHQENKQNEGKEKSNNRKRVFKLKLNLHLLFLITKGTLQSAKISLHFHFLLNYSNYYLSSLVVLRIQNFDYEQFCFF